MISKFFKFLLLLMMLGIFTEYVFSYVYARGHSPWQSDYRYLFGGTNADMVDGLRVYKIRLKEYEPYGIRELSKKEPAFETKDRRRIEEFVSATNEWIWEAGNSSDPDYFPASDGCYPLSVETDKFYIVMYDNTFMRAGYLRAAFCDYEGREYLKITTPSVAIIGSNFYYNETLIPVFKELNLL